MQGEAYAIPKMTGLKTKQVREKPGDPKQLGSVEDANDQFANRIQPALSSWEVEIEARKMKRQEQRDERNRHKTKLKKR